MRKIPLRGLFAAVVATIAGVVAFRYLPEPLPELTREELLAEIRAGRVQQVDIEDQDIILGESSSRGEFRSPFDRRRDVGLADELRALGIAVLYTRSPPR